MFTLWFIVDSGCCAASYIESPGVLRCATWSGMVQLGVAHWGLEWHIGARSATLGPGVAHSGPEWHIVARCSMEGQIGAW